MKFNFQCDHLSLPDAVDEKLVPVRVPAPQDNKTEVRISPDTIAEYEKL